MSELKRVLIMAGGTGGHVFPGLAVADYMNQQGVDVHWLGTAQGIESRLVPEAGFPLHLIQIGGLRGKGIKSLIMAPWRIVNAVWQARRIIHAVDPNVVIGMGGFASGPGGLASWLCGVPLVIHEQNAKPGLTNRVLAHLAKRVLSGFPDVFKASNKVVAIGNPVRVEIAKLPPPSVRVTPARERFHLLVLGGSLGAKALNDVVPQALSRLGEDERPEVIHQTGEKHFDEAKKSYESMGVKANLSPFVKDMAEVYSWADMVLCRAGALTVAELCSAGVGAIFVPFPFAVDDHQTANAEFMVKRGAALCVQQTELTEARLADIVVEFSRSPEKRLGMAEAAYALRQVEVAKKIYDICREVCR